MRVPVFTVDKDNVYSKSLDMRFRAARHDRSIDWALVSG